MTDIAPPFADRPRDAARTREVILRSAQDLFATQGYATTGVREIAASAGVNSSLVRRYFGSKQGLLRAVLEDLLCIPPIVEGDRSGFGQRAATMLLAADSISNPVAIMILALADTEAREMCRKLVHEHVILPLADWLGGEDALDRAAQLNTLWTGFITTRQLIPLDPLANARVAPTREWIARTTQAIADGR